MEISEVSIGQEHKTEKKFSPKIVQETQMYLAERGISKDDLRKDQWAFVAEYIKGKHLAKFGLMAMILATILSIWSAFATYKSLKSQAVRLAGIIPAETVIILRDGTKKVIEFDQQVIETYGKLHSLMGFGIAFFSFVSVATFSSMIGFLIKMHKREEIFQAFLPTVKSKITTKPGNSVEFRNID